MSTEPMTLLERLRSPQRVCDPEKSCAPLDALRATADMCEAADALEGMAVCRRALIAEVKRLSEALAEANDVLRSAHAIAQRHGAQTGWESFLARVSSVLKKQHAIMYPDAAATND